MNDSLTSLNTAFQMKDASTFQKAKVADKPIEIMYFSAK
jgi:hypothetical protein